MMDPRFDSYVQYKDGRPLSLYDIDTFDYNSVEGNVLILERTGVQHHVNIAEISSFNFIVAHIDIESMYSIPKSRDRIKRVVFDADCNRVTWHYDYIAGCKLIQTLCWDRATSITKLRGVSA